MNTKRAGETNSLDIKTIPARFINLMKHFLGVQREYFIVVIFIPGSDCHDIMTVSWLGKRDSQHTYDRPP